MTTIAHQTLAGIVLNDYRSATVLEKYQLDFCCKGKRTLAEACAEKGLSADLITNELESLHGPENATQMPFRKMTAEQLIAHIVTQHHFYVKQAMPQIYDHLERVAIKHGDRFPAMIEVFGLFAEIKREMTSHMQKEEIVLFPAIKKAENAFANQETLGNDIRNIKGAVNVMEMEHDNAGEGMSRIRELTNNYEEPIGACTTFKLSLAELKAFEEDLHRHVHLENNILFPMAKKLIG